MNDTRHTPQIYLAPMEGITGYIVRNAFHHQFGGIDKYFTPFIPAAKRMGRKILRDLDPANNQGIRLVPQLISNNAEEIKEMVLQLQDLGFSEININLGCPSGTVVSKNRGSGMLKDPKELDHFLDGIMEGVSACAHNAAITVKTRIGFTDLSLWPEILSIYRKYPFDELIIHPRLRSELYTGYPHLEAFQLAYDAYQADPGRLCYNGDVWDMHCYQNIQSRFPAVEKIMIGRGLLGRPYLARLIRQEQEAEAGEIRKRLRAFHDEIYAGYLEIFSGERDVFLHMKEIWANLGRSFQDSEKLVRKLMKSRTPAEYKVLADQILDTLELSMI